MGEELENESRNPIIILNSWNKGFENSMTIDLHGQHVKEGVKILKHHLVFGVWCISSLSVTAPSHHWIWESWNWAIGAETVGC